MWNPWLELFGGLAVELVYAVIFFVAVTAVFTYAGMRKRAASWSGVVTDIRRRTLIRDDGDEEEMVVSYRTDVGRKGNIKLKPHAYYQLYPDLNIGDRLVRVAGEYMPKVEEQARA